MPVDWHTHLQMDAALEGVVHSRCIYMLMVWGKETEFRAHLTQQLLALKPAAQVTLQGLLSAHSPTAQAAGELILSILSKTLLYMTRVDRTWSNRHLHFRVGRVLGWLPLFQSFGILCKSPRGELKFGGEGAYCIQPFNLEMLTTFQDIEKLETIERLYGPSRGFLDFQRIQTRVNDATSGLVFADVNGYINRWTFRAEQVSLRHMHGVDKTFDVPRSCTVDQFASAFPDQADHLPIWSDVLGVDKIHPMASKVGYKGSLFYLTMFQCLLLDPMIVAISPELLASPKFAKAVRRIRLQTKDKYGHHGLPAAICKLAAIECM